MVYSAVSLTICTNDSNVLFKAQSRQALRSKKSEPEVFARDSRDRTIDQVVALWKQDGSAIRLCQGLSRFCDNPHHRLKLEWRLGDASLDSDYR
jgi:hypothetical protein